MPITKSAKKEFRKSRRRYVRNLNVKRNIKKLISEIKKLSKEKKEKQAREVFVKFQKAIDKAAQRNVIHKNKAARLKSRLLKRIRKIKEVPPSLKKLRRTSKKKK